MAVGFFDLIWVDKVSVDLICLNFDGIVMRFNIVFDFSFNISFDKNLILRNNDVVLVNISGLI